MLVALTPRSYISAAASSTIRPLVSFPRRVVGSGMGCGLDREVAGAFGRREFYPMWASHTWDAYRAHQERYGSGRSGGAAAVSEVPWEAGAVTLPGPLHASELYRGVQTLRAG